ncbi:MAG: FAD:protein FMN transferase [Oligoflexia bacterium]|nr:FAD:protein FMN transferase [Oligoflexia bacterium]
MNKILYSAFMVLLMSCSKNREYKSEQLHLGTSFSITVSTGKKPEHKKIKAIAERAFEKVVYREKKIFSVYSRDSELFNINGKLKKNSLLKGYSEFTVSRDLFHVIDRALYVSEKTGWTFDVTYKSIADLWKTKIPSPAEIENAMKKTGREAVKTIPPDRVLIRNGASVGLGGIAKGYIVDGAAGFLKENGLNDYIINAGGDIALSGSKGGEPWTVSVLDPLTSGRAKCICRFSGKTVSVVTSGSYYRFTTINGKKYSHIIDPVKGIPTETDIASITVISKNTLLADAFATGFYIWGFDKVKDNFDYLDKLELGVIIISKNGDTAINGTARYYCEV